MRKLNILILAALTAVSGSAMAVGFTSPSPGGPGDLSF